MKELTKMERVVVGMPALSHWPGKQEGRQWDVDGSEVVKWLLERKEVKEWVFSTMQGRRLIVYDEAAGVWVGVGSAAAMELADGKGISQGQEEVVKKEAGRPSKIKAILGLDLAGFWQLLYEVTGQDGVSPHGAARVLMDWSKQANGLEISLATGKRVIRSLIARGSLEVVKGPAGWFEQKVRPVKPVNSTKADPGLSS